MPPWAQALALSASVPLVRSRASRPSAASRHAVQRPAMPAPMMRGTGFDIGWNIDRRDGGHCSADGSLRRSVVRVGGAGAPTTR